MQDDVEAIVRLSPVQRRAYIDTSRRSQPIAELDRKARKAKGRHGGWTESSDLTLARWAANDIATRDRLFTTCWINYCSLCGEFGRGRWEDESKRYPGPIAHKARCVHGSDYGTPYPGWSAVTSPIPCPPGPQAPGWVGLAVQSALRAGEGK